MLKNTLIAYAAALVAVAILDALWLGLIAKPLYQQGIGHLMADKPNIPAASVFYFLFPIGLMVFAVHPGALIAPSWQATLTAAALFGLFTYATYDLSNLATLKNWPLSLAAIDIAWGIFLSTASAAAAKLALSVTH